MQRVRCETFWRFPVTESKLVFGEGVAVVLISIGVFLLLYAEGERRVASGIFASLAFDIPMIGAVVCLSVGIVLWFIIWAKRRKANREHLK